MPKLIFTAILFALSFTLHAQQGKVVGTVTMEGESDDAIDPAANIAGDKEVPETVYYFVDKMPSFAGGMDKYVKKNLHCTGAAKDADVTLTFTVQKDGKLTEVKITKGAGTSCDDAVIQMLQTMPAWTPGELKGQKVLVSSRLKIHFEGGKASVKE